MDIQIVLLAQPLLFLAIVWGYCRFWGFKPNI
jgi:hypothetical protein